MYLYPCINKDHLNIKEANTLLLLPVIASSRGLNTLESLHCQLFSTDDDGGWKQAFKEEFF